MLGLAGSGLRDLLSLYIVNCIPDCPFVIMQGEPGTQSYVFTITPPHTHIHCTEGDIRDPHARRAVALMDRADLEDKQLKLMEENQVRPSLQEFSPGLHPL